MNIDVENFRNRRNDQRWNRVSVGDVIERITWSQPDKECLIAAPDAVVNPKHARVTYRQANDLINRVANALLAMGLQPATRVAMLSENSNEAWLAKIGIAKAGMVAVPVNIMMAPDVIANCLDRVEAQIVIADAAQWEKLGGDLAPTGLKPIMLVGGKDGGEIPSFDDFIADHGTEEPDVTIHGDDIWEILFTSGTTAAPKAVMISHTYAYMAAFNQTLSMTRGLEHEQDLRAAIFTPMTFHIGDLVMLFGPLMTAATLVMGRKPDGPMIAQCCTDEKITCLWGGSPQFVESVIKACQSSPGKYDLTSITAMFYGWAALDPKSLAAFKAITRPDVMVWGIIGQTECVPCHYFPIKKHQDLYERTAPALNYIGVPVPMLGATVMDAEGNDLRGQPGVQGEAVYRSPAMFSGYYRDPEATKEALKGGWMHSGDSFVYDENGLRIMVDRYKDIVKSGGENVSSIRVESVLQQHPAIARAAVVGIPDDRWGEMVTACVILEPGQDYDEADVIAFCREKLAGFETPKKIVPMDAFPETVGGKILKYKLRAGLNEDAKAAAE
ncbi:AMP-binding protein [Minwuia sp.]|uniref:AMP-binding protein n=1 Tax=Minwuia sp. TaxID=2493630 RepID=UPI003A8CE6C2